MPASLPRAAQKYAKEWFEELVRLEKARGGNQTTARWLETIAVARMVPPGFEHPRANDELVEAAPRAPTPIKAKKRRAQV